MNPEAEAGWGKLAEGRPGKVRASLSGTRQGALGLFDKCLEGGFVVNGQLRECFSIQLDSGLFQARHKSAVGHSVMAAGSVDTDNPQLAEFPFLVAPVAVGELPRPIACLFGIAIEPACVSKISPRPFQRSLAALAGSGMVLCFRHVGILLLFWLAAGSPILTRRAALRSLELVRASDFDESRHTGSGHTVLTETTLLLDRAVAHEVPFSRRPVQHFARAGYLELLRDGFACFDHGKTSNQTLRRRIVKGIFRQICSIKKKAPQNRAQEIAAGRILADYGCGICWL